MYVGGAFIRSESGGVYPVRQANATPDQAIVLLGNACQASRKDLRNAVEAAEKAGAGWSGRSAFNRGQILYRIGEMMESRANELADSIRGSSGVSAAAARKEVATAVDRVVYYAGWADKYAQVLGSTNPVASPSFKFTVSEPVGVIGVIAADFAPLLGLINQLAPIIASGNTVVALASELHPAPAVLLGEILAVSDVPGGVVNLLTGRRAPLLTPFGSHEQIRGLDFHLTPDQAREVEQSAAASVKRCKWRQEEEGYLYSAEAESIYEIRSFIEFKTTWHPHWV
jgi:aldehyde dehydrogenase (NAD+)